MRRLITATRRIALGLCCCLLGFQTPTIAAAETDPLSFAESRTLFERNDNYAIVVGVDQYTKANRLNYAVADAERLAGELDAQGYTVRLITDYEADPEELLDEIRRIADVITQDGRHRRGNLVFAFSGHGFRQGEENYLATSRTDPANLTTTALPMARLKNVLAESGVRQRVLFVDACRNDPSKGAPLANQTFAADEDAEGLAILYSTGAGDLSWEDPELGQGVFSYFLAEGLGGEAVDERGYVTFDSLYRYVQRNVKNYVLEEFKTKQIPYIGGERTGEFVIAKADGIAIDAPSGNRLPLSSDGDVPLVPAPKNGRRGWVIAGAIAGAVVLGVLASGSSGGSDDTSDAGAFTLRVPTL